MHGANRLGTNSLTDLLVFGKAAGDNDDRYLASNKGASRPAADAGDYMSRLNRLKPRRDGANVHETRAELQRTMQRHCGVFRFPEMLVEGVAKIKAVAERVAMTEIADKSQVFNTPASRLSNSTT